MDRNKESKKSIVALKIVAVVIAPILYECFIWLFSLGKLGSLWETLFEQELNPATMWGYLFSSGINFWSWFSLILCRIFIYTFPALLFYIIQLFVVKKDRRKKQLKILAKCFNLQFLGYLIYQGITVIFALDYLIGLEPFSNISIIMAMIGYILTIGRNKNMELGKVNDKNNNEF